MGTNFSELTKFDQIQGGNVGYLLQSLKLCCAFLLLKMCAIYYRVPAYVQLIPAAIVVVTRATPFFESVDSTVRLTATIVEAGILGISAD